MTAVAASDQELLQEFVGGRDEAAFAALVRRHGPMVYGVCRRVLKDDHETEDAFQATFIVLSRKAPGIARAESLGPWLHQVATRVAYRAHARRKQRAGREIALNEATHDASAPPADGAARQLRPLLDEEIGRLPEKYRVPLILCYLEGKTTDEAAQQLGWPRGTVAGRMSRARDMLRSRLSRRGLTVSGAAFAAVLVQAASVKAAPPAVLAAMSQSAPATALADGVFKASLALKVKIALGSAVAIIAIAATAVMLAPAAPARMVFQDFDAATPRLNADGQSFPYCDGGLETGPVGGVTTDATDAVSGRSLIVRVEAPHRLRVQFAPRDRKGWGFARDFAQRPAEWRFDTYDRLRFFVKRPTSAVPHLTNGTTNMAVCANIKKANEGPDDSVAYHHRFNVPAGSWTQCLVNAHPHLRMRSTPETCDHLPRPTGEPGINYCDAMSKLFIEDRQPPTAYPADYRLDEMEFLQASGPENDAQVFSIAATYRATDNRLILTWSRPETEDNVPHEVRFGFEDIHRIGWGKAQTAPGGIVKPAGKGIDHSGMIYDSTALPLRGRSVLYLAIKPRDAERFSQVVVPLNLR